MAPGPLSTRDTVLNTVLRARVAVRSGPAFQRFGCRDAARLRQSRRGLQRATWRCVGRGADPGPVSHIYRDAVPWKEIIKGGPHSVGSKPGSASRRPEVRGRTTGGGPTPTGGVNGRARAGCCRARTRIGDPGVESVQRPRYTYAQDRVLMACFRVEVLEAYRDTCACSGLAQPHDVAWIVHVPALGQQDSCLRTAGRPRGRGPVRSLATWFRVAVRLPREPGGTA